MLKRLPFLAFALVFAHPAGATTIVKQLDPTMANQVRELAIAIRGQGNRRDAYVRLLALPGDARARGAQTTALNQSLATLAQMNLLAAQIIRGQSGLPPRFTIRSDMKLMQTADGWAVVVPGP